METIRFTLTPDGEPSELALRSRVVLECDVLPRPITGTLLELEEAGARTIVTMGLSRRDWKIYEHAMGPHARPSYFAVRPAKTAERWRWRSVG